MAPTQQIRSVVRVVDRPRPTNPQQRMEAAVTQNMCEAETNKVRVLELQGGNDNNINLNIATNPAPFNVDNQLINASNELITDQNVNEPGLVLFGPNQFMRTAIMDEDYLIVAAHVDENLERRIRNGEFVDFTRLLPRDRVQMQQDNRIELINQDGKAQLCSCFSCWRFRNFRL